MPGPLFVWDHRGPCHIAAEASATLGPPRLPPHGCRSPLRLGTIKATTAWIGWPPLLREHAGPRRMGTGTSFHLGSQRLSPNWCMGPCCVCHHSSPCCIGAGPLLIGTTEARAALAGAPFALGSSMPQPRSGPPAPPMHWRRGMFRFVIIVASLHGRGRLHSFEITKALPESVRGPLSPWHHSSFGRIGAVPLWLWDHHGWRRTGARASSFFCDH